MIPVNTAFNREIDLVNSAGNPVLGATLTVTLSKDGGAFASISPTVTERGNGAYNLALTAAHNDTVGSHTMYITATGGAVAQYVYDQVASESHIKRNRALAKFPFQMTDATTHAPLPGLTGLTVTRSIDGLASVVGTLTNITEHPDADGTYLVDFGAGDLDGKVIKLKAVKAGCDTTHERIITVP